MLLPENGHVHHIECAKYKWHLHARQLLKPMDHRGVFAPCLVTTDRRLGHLWIFTLLAVLCCLLSYSAVNAGNDSKGVWNLTLVILGASGIATGRHLFFNDNRDNLARIAIVAALLFPVYAACQLVPLPETLLRIVSPTRGEMTSSLRAMIPSLRFAPITVGPTRTWLHLSRIVAYALLFVSVREIARRAKDHPWLPTIPIMLVGGFEAALGLYQFFGGDGSPSGTYASRDHFAGCLEMTWPFAIAYGVSPLARVNWIEARR